MDRRALLVAGGVGAAVFLVALASYLAGPGLADAQAAQALGSGPAWLVALADLLATAGSAPVAFAAVALAGVLLARRGRHVEAIGIGAVWLASELSSYALKLVFARPRPLGALEDGYSFPSGHAVRAASLAAIAVWLLLQGSWPRKRAALLVAIAAAWAVVQAWERLALGVHYMSDVVGGLGLGVAVACFGLAALDGYRKSRSVR